MKKFKKVLSLFISLTLMMSMFTGFTAFAEETTNDTSNAVEDIEDVTSDIDDTLADIKKEADDKNTAADDKDTEADNDSVGASFQDSITYSVSEPEFALVTQVFEYGQDVTHLIIDAVKDVTANSLDTETFSVSTINKLPTNNSIIYEGAREIVDIYVNDTPEIDGSVSNGRYIIVALKYGYTIDGSRGIHYTNANYKLDMDYSVTQNKDYTYSDSVTASNLTYTQNGVKNLGEDDFELITYNDQMIRVYSPEANTALPLVLWNHGGGETYRESNGVSAEGAQLIANMGAVAWVQDEYPCYVLAPQRGTGTGYTMQNTIDYINSLVAQGKVDPSRIYMAGCSAGGAETLSYLQDYPSYFAAAVLVCPAGSASLSEAGAKRIKDIPMWFFHSSDDPTVRVANTRTKIEQLRALDPAELKYTEVDNVPYEEHGKSGLYDGHWSWILPLNNYYSEEYETNVFDWMFSKTNAAFKNFDLVTQVFEYGQDVTHLIIDAEKDVDANSLDTETFSVSTINKLPTNNSIIYEGAREIVDIYVNDTPKIDGSVSNGRYIIVALKYGYTIDGSRGIHYTNANYKLDMDYSVTQNKDYTYSDSVTASNLTYTQNGVKNLGEDDFELITYNDQMIRVYSPEANTALPLVLWNHGGGETYRESNGVSAEGAQLIANMGAVAWVQDEYPCYVLAPQRGTGTGYTMQNTIDYINSLVAQGKVDPSRIYMAGCSAGGAETLSYLQDYPSYFAAAVLVCPAGSASLSEAGAKRIKDIPMWFFHSSDDPTVRVANTRTKIEQLRALDPADLKYTEVENVPYEEHGESGLYDGHWSWILPLNNYYSEEYETNVFDWMFAQKAVSLDASARILEYIIQKANRMLEDGSLENAVESVVRIFETALENAESVMERILSGDYKVTEGEIKEAILSLQRAMELTDYRVANKSDLLYLIALVEPDAKNGEVYTPSTFKAFTEELTAAKLVAADDTLLEGIEEDEALINNAWIALMEAWTNLKRIPNKDYLTSLVMQGEAIDQSLITEASALKLNVAMQAAQAVLNDLEATEEDVANAEAVMIEALNVEYLNDGTSDSNGDSNGDSDNDDDSNGDSDSDTTSDSNQGDTNDTNKPGAGKDGKDTGKNKTTSPKTGDAMPIISLLLLFSLAGITLLYSKKRKEQ